MNTPSNPPAFPAATCGEWQEGLSMRDYFAAAAMQGMLASLAGGHMVDGLSISAKKCELSISAELAANAYETADAMLSARDGGQGCGLAELQAVGKGL